MTRRSHNPEILDVCEAIETRRQVIPAPPGYISRFVDGTGPDGAVSAWYAPVAAWLLDIDGLLYGIDMTGGAENGVTCNNVEGFTGYHFCGDCAQAGGLCHEHRTDGSAYL